MSKDVDLENTTSEAVDDDKPIDRSDIIQDRAFRGEFSYDNIKESIINQANDYMNIEDRNDYITIFFEQYHKSCDFALSDDLEEYKDDAIDYLNNLKDQFLTFMDELIEKRLNITINEDRFDEYDHEWIVSKLYQFFFIDARDNFKTCISLDVTNRMTNEAELDDKEYFDTIQDLMNLYTPLLTMTPTEFLKYRGDEEIIELFDSGVVCGNFLTKYSPKLYANEEFQVELINHITMIQSMNDKENGNE